MKITIVGDRFQIRGALTILKRAMATPKSLYPKRRPSAIAIRNKKIGEESRTLVAAFKTVRNDPNQQEIAADLLEAFRDISKRTPEILAIAAQLKDPRP